MSKVVRTLIYNDQVSLTLADTTALVKEGASLHFLSKTSAYIFGKALSAMVFMSACLKGENGEISLAVKTAGEGEEIAVSGNRALKIRGYIGNVSLAGECNEQTETLAFAEGGSLTIIRDDGYSRPFVGACAFPLTGGLDGAFEEYFRISEQLPTRIATIVAFDGAKISFAGAAVLQPLPFADEETLKKVEETDLQALLTSIEKIGVEKTVVEYYGQAEKALEVREAEYRCNCSREYLTRVLVSLGETQMREIIREDGSVHIHCHYCNTDYDFTDEDADRIFAKKD